MRTGTTGDTIRSDDENRRGGRRRSEQAHSAILEATLGLLDEVGYGRLTIEGVAARAQVGKTTVYRWWPSKRALVIEAIATLVKVGPIKTIGESRTDLRAAIQATLDGYLDLPLGDTVPALAAELLRDPDGAAEFQALFQPRLDSMRVIIEDAADRGDLPADVDAHLLHDIYAGTLLYRLLVSRRSTDGVVDKLLELFLDREIPRRLSEMSDPA